MDAEKRAALAAGGKEALAPAAGGAPVPAEAGGQGARWTSRRSAPTEKELAASQAKKRGAAGSLFRLVEREEVTYALTPAGLRRPRPR